VLDGESVAAIVCLVFVQDKKIQVPVAAIIKNIYNNSSPARQERGADTVTYLKSGSCDSPIRLWSKRGQIARTFVLVLLVSYIKLTPHNQR